MPQIGWSKRLINIPFISAAFYFAPLLCIKPSKRTKVRQKGVDSRGLPTATTSLEAPYRATLRG